MNNTPRTCTKANTRRYPKVVALTKKVYQWTHMYIYLRGAFDIAKNLGQVIQFTPGQSTKAEVLLSQREFWRTGQRMIRRAAVHPKQVAAWEGIPAPTKAGTYRMFEELGLSGRMTQDAVDEKIKFLESVIPVGLVTVEMLGHWHQLLREYRLPRPPFSE